MDVQETVCKRVFVLQGGREEAQILKNATLHQDEYLYLLLTQTHNCHVLICDVIINFYWKQSVKKLESTISDDQHQTLTPFTQSYNNEDTMSCCPAWSLYTWTLLWLVLLVDFTSYVAVSEWEQQCFLFWVHMFYTEQLGRRTLQHSCLEHVKIPNNLKFGILISLLVTWYVMLLIN